MAERSSRASPNGRRRRLHGVVLLSTLLVATLTAVVLAQGGYGDEDDQAAAPADAGMGVSMGVFTEEQAQRGAAVFGMNCAGCHGPTLQGGMGPRLNPINEAWHGNRLAALYRFVSQNMPFNAPGSLEPQQYADVLSFVLSENGFPAGEAELPPDDEQLEQYQIDAPPAE